MLSPDGRRLFLGADAFHNHDLHNTYDILTLAYTVA